MRRFLSPDASIFLSPCRMHFKMWVSKLFSFFDAVISSFTQHHQKWVIIYVNTPFISYHHQFSSIGTQNSLDRLVHLAHVLCQPSAERNCFVLEKNFSIFSAFRSRVDGKKVKSEKEEVVSVGMVRQKERKEANEP